MSTQSIECSNEFEAMAQRLFTDHATPDIIAAAEDGIFADTLWKAIAQSGIPLTLVSESSGGIGASVTDAAAILRMAGRYAVAAPVLDTLLGNLAAAQAGLATTDGPAGLVFLGAQELLVGPDLALTIESLELPWPTALERIVLVAPPAAPGAAAHVAVAHLGATRGQAVPLPQGSAEPVRDLHGEARLYVPSNELSITGCGQIEQADAYANLYRLAGLLRAAQMLGALEWCTERSIDYANERKQFGREIGRFQIVQQLLAEMASGVVAASAIVSAAVKAAHHAGTSAEQEPLIAVARSRLGDSIDVAVAVSHQVHGAIGFSREYALNFRTRRLMAWRDEFGSVAHWRKVLAKHFAGLDANAVWPAMTALSMAAQQ